MVAGPPLCSILSRTSENRRAASVALSCFRSPRSLRSFIGSDYLIYRPAGARDDPSRGRSGPEGLGGPGAGDHVVRVDLAEVGPVGGKGLEPGGQGELGEGRRQVGRRGEAGDGDALVLGGAGDLGGEAGRVGARVERDQVVVLGEGDGRAVEQVLG